MSEESPKPTIGYLAEGKVRLKIGSASPRTIESPYVFAHVTGRH
jgi:hypothetical protein